MGHNYTRNPYSYDECVSKSEMVRKYGERFTDAYTKANDVDYSYVNKYKCTCCMYATEKVIKYKEAHPELTKKTITYKRHILFTDANGGELVTKYKNDITMTLLDGTKISGSNYLLQVFKKDIKKYYVANYITYWRHNKTNYNSALAIHNSKRAESWRCNKGYIHHKFDDEYINEQGEFEDVDEFNDYWSDKYSEIKDSYNMKTKEALVRDLSEQFASIGIDIKQVVNELN